MLPWTGDRSFTRPPPKGQYKHGENGDIATSRVVPVRSDRGIISHRYGAMTVIGEIHLACHIAGQKKKNVPKGQIFVWRVVCIRDSWAIDRSAQGFQRDRTEFLWPRRPWDSNPPVSMMGTCSSCRCCITWRTGSTAGPRRAQAKSRLMILRTSVITIGFTYLHQQTFPPCRLATSRATVGQGFPPRHVVRASSVVHPASHPMGTRISSWK
jgi:hypothetical protein